MGSRSAPAILRKFFPKSSSRVGSILWTGRCSFLGEAVTDSID